MHFTGRTWRPPDEAWSCIIQANSSCTYNQSAFCSLYNTPFRISPISEIEADLKEIKAYQPYARRLFVTGGNYFRKNQDRVGNFGYQTALERFTG